MPAWINQGCAEYQKRMPREIALEIVELKPEHRGPGKSPDQVREAEAQRILGAAGRDFLVALDERGQGLTTLQLADHLHTWLDQGGNVAFAIGGADGLHPTITSTARWPWSLSPLTLPHGLVRVLLAEQLYRAWTVLHHHPYHRA